MGEPYARQFSRPSRFRGNVDSGTNGNANANGNILISASPFASSSSPGESSSGSSPNSNSLVMPGASSSLTRPSSGIPKQRGKHTHLPGMLSSSAVPQAEVSANMRSLQESMNEFRSINAAPGSGASTPIGKHFGRSSSERALGSGINIPKPGPPAGFSKQRTSPSITEVFSQSPTDVDSLLEEGSTASGFSLRSGNTPIITSPPISDVGGAHFSDGGGDVESGLTSPNLMLSTLPSSVSSYGISPTAAVANSRLGNASAALQQQLGGAMAQIPRSSAATAPATASSSSSVFSQNRKTSMQTTTVSVSGADGIINSSTSTQAESEAESSVKVQQGDRSFEQKNTSSDMKHRLEQGGTVAEKSHGVRTQAQRLTSHGELLHQSSDMATVKGAKVMSGGVGYEKSTSALSSRKLSMMDGVYQQSSHSSVSTSAKLSLGRSSSLLSNNQLEDMMNKLQMTHEDVENGLRAFDDLERLTPTTNLKSVENALVKYCGIMSGSVNAMKKNENADSLADWMSKVNDMMTKAWEVPSFGHEIGVTLCDILRKNGGLDLLIDNLQTDNENLQYQSAKLLQQCLVTENRGYVIEVGLHKVVNVAKTYTEDISNIRRSRVGTGTLEHLFKHSKDTCGDVISMGGLDTVVNQCKSSDVETLRHCASALANVAMYGGTENQEAMIKRKVQSWLFPLAFHDDDTIKYYACLAIAALVANKELEAAVQKSGTLELIEPFVQNHTPKEFAETSATHSHGQSPNWLKRLIPLLTSHREEARNLAAFHFCMEAEIKKEQNKTELFREISAIESLKKVASRPNGIASKYAAQALRLIGEEVPHKLSQQVPTWSVEDVKEWVKQIGFPAYADSFAESRVDGDLLLQLSEEMLREDIQMRNGILRRRFLRELSNLKRVADYSCVDATGLNEFLQTMGPEYCVYAYDLINAGIDRDTLMNINDEQMLTECGIRNKIHRMKVLQGAKVERGDISITEESMDKCLDVFISYRRANGSQLASLLKVHLEIRNISVFLDVDRLNSGKFDNNLLQSIRSAKHFVLVLTPGALDRCFGDVEMRDWIHKEVACAIQSNCTIIPVFDNFSMPDPSLLPDSMRAVTSFNAVNWVHDYQEACVDRIERWIRGDNSIMMDRFLNSQPSNCSAYSGTNSTFNRQNTYLRTVSQDNSSCNSGDNGNGNSPPTPPVQKEIEEQPQ